ncbi:probable calcium-binding protein CML23 [Punica granatum]|uniref:Probable calcium-binding protein CML23 n=1 Tax=Punica granatum TaxID=22663 RepID=A0A218VVU6_PUNGR|nr:probable calcium-binding protein CML23 [Punica granatum]OWM64389.1 hypothetical protein CDL15_Pgr020356 [Punica granatum]
MMAKRSNSGSKRAAGAVAAGSCCLGNIDEVIQVFKQYDKNGDGRISCEELRDVLSALAPSPASLEEAKRAMSEIDKDGNGYIDLDEFTDLILGGSGSDTSKELKDAFDLYDLDQNGLISARELHEVMKKLGQKCSLKDCRKMIGSVDKDGDGNVNFEEFKVMMTTTTTTTTN